LVAGCCPKNLANCTKKNLWSTHGGCRMIASPQPSARSPIQARGNYVACYVMQKVIEWQIKTNKMTCLLLYVVPDLSGLREFTCARLKILLQWISKSFIQIF